MTLGRIVKPPAAGGVDFVSCGENSLDTIGVVNWRAPLPAKQRLTSLFDLPGGQAATAAVACARLGWRTRYVGTIGDDGGGHAIRSRFEVEHVDAVLTVRPGVPTRRAIVLVDEHSGDRAVMEARDPRLDFADGEVADEVFGGCRVLLVDGSDVAQSIRAAHAAQRAGARTILDLDRPGERVSELLAFIDVIVLPEQVVPVLAGVPDLGLALRILARDTGAAAVVATMGPAGALAWCRDQEVRSPAVSGQVADTTGAGDAFRAGFAAFWLGQAGMDPELEDLLHAANLVASLNCRAVGAQEGLPYRDEVPEGLRGGV